MRYNDCRNKLRTQKIFKFLLQVFAVTACSESFLLEFRPLFAFESANINKKTLELEEISYGPLYIVERRESYERRLDFSLKYTIGLGTPQYQLYGLQVGGVYHLTDWFFVGAVSYFHKIAITELQRNLERELAWLETKVLYPSPKYSIYGRGGMVPIEGLISLFGKKVVPFSLSLSSLVGATRFSDGFMGPSFGLMIEHKVQLAEPFGFSVGYAQFWDWRKNAPSGSKNVARTQVECGVYARF